MATSLRVRQATLEARRAARAQLMKRHGLVGQRLGKHRIQEGQVDVLLGEELSETLRELKARPSTQNNGNILICLQPQGNLFRDRFLSLQHRALVEPRVPVLYVHRRYFALYTLIILHVHRPRRRRTKVKDYEKHAWKRFE